MGSFIKKKNKPWLDDWGFAYGAREEPFMGLKSYRLNIQRKFFTNDVIECFVRGKDGEYEDLEIGNNKSKYAFHQKGAFSEDN